MLFLDHTQVKYCKLKNNDQSILGLVYNDKIFIRAKAFPKEELEAAIKECREEYLDHEERSKIPTLLVKDKDSVGIWMQSDRFASSDVTVSSSPEKQSSEIPGTSANKNQPEKDLSKVSIRQIATEMRSETGVEIKTRRHNIKLYQRCFLGNEAVDWITKRVKISRTDAVALGQKMIDKGIFCHVLEQHQFKDEGLFYRFKDDEGKSLWNSSI